jgi:hypothetical protein
LKAGKQAAARIRNELVNLEQRLTYWASLPTIQKVVTERVERPSALQIVQEVKHYMKFAVRGVDVYFLPPGMGTSYKNRTNLYAREAQHPDAGRFIKADPKKYGRHAKLKKFSFIPAHHSRRELKDLTEAEWHEAISRAQKERE